MPFQPVSETIDHSGGNFSTTRRKFFNSCGSAYYEGSISFTDAKHKNRVVPIFSDECLEDDAPETYALLKKLRKGLRAPSSSLFGAYTDGHRSIHQNENGYLPYKDDGGVATSSSAAGLMYMTFGHYHKDSFALLVRSAAELRYELMPVLPVVNASFDS